jgi:transcriptional regulator with XRE-family HTH domain
MYNTKTFAGKMKSIRLHRGFTQEQLAKEIGVPASAISHWETGRRTPSLDNFAKICEELSVSPGWMLTYN